MPRAEPVWATVPYAYALATRRAGADRIGEDIAEALRLPLELDDDGAHAAPLRQLAVPALVLHGAEDRLVPPATAALAAGHPGAEHWSWQGAAHLYATDQPDADRQVLRFLGATPRPGGRVAVAQLALEHLAGRRARQRLDEVDDARQLVAGEPLARERDQLLGAQARRPRPGRRTPSRPRPSARPARR